VSISEVASAGGFSWALLNLGNSLCATDDILAIQLPNHPVDCFMLGKKTGGGVYITTEAVQCWVGIIPAGKQVLDVKVS
jgi:hypothetical protein